MSTTAVDTLSKYGSDFQSKVIAAMLLDTKFLDQYYDIIRDEYFDSDAFQWIVKTVMKYYQDFKTEPTLDVFRAELIKRYRDDDTMSDLIIKDLKNVWRFKDANDLDYIKEEFGNFCKNQCLRAAILKSVDYLSVGDFTKIKAAIDHASQQGVERNFGTDWREDMEKRFEDEIRNVIETPWAVINNLTDGGIGAGELFCCVAPAGHGKSWVLAKIGAHLLKQGKNVLHYTCELNEAYICSRYDSILSGLPPQETKHHKDTIQAIALAVPGTLKVKYYPPKTATIATLHAHIQRLKTSLQWKPDVIIVDYGDLLLPLSMKGNKYEDSGNVFLELRRFAGELGLGVWTASQTNRHGHGDDVIEIDRMSDSFIKVQIADFIMSMSRKTNDRSSNTGRMMINKNRRGTDGKVFPMYVDFSSGKIEILEENSDLSRQRTTHMNLKDMALQNLRNGAGRSARE